MRSTRRLVLAACAWAAVLAQDQTCVDDPNWVKNGDEPWKDCGWVAEYIPTRCSVRGAVLSVARPEEPLRARGFVPAQIDCGGPEAEET